jgi:hypothetical protein
MYVNGELRARADKEEIDLTLTAFLSRLFVVFLREQSVALDKITPIGDKGFCFHLILLEVKMCVLALHYTRDKSERF